MSNIVGLDLNIDQNYLAQAVQQTVMLGISEALNGKNEITSQIVKMVLNTKVNKNGGIDSYASSNTQTLLEYYVKNLLTDLVKEEIKAIAEAKKPEIQMLIRNELSKQSNLDKFVDTFISNTTKALDQSWSTNIDISFKPRKDEY